MTWLGLGKLLVAGGIVLLIGGAFLIMFSRMGITRLPGDLEWQRGPVRIFIPIATSIVLSVVLTIVLNIVARLFR